MWPRWPDKQQRDRVRETRRARDEHYAALPFGGVDEQAPEMEWQYRLNQSHHEAWDEAWGAGMWSPNGFDSNGGDR